MLVKILAVLVVFSALVIISNLGWLYLLLKIQLWVNLFEILLLFGPFVGRLPTKLFSRFAAVSICLLQNLNVLNAHRWHYHFGLLLSLRRTLLLPFFIWQWIILLDLHKPLGDFLFGHIIGDAYINISRIFLIEHWLLIVVKLDDFITFFCGPLATNTQRIVLKTTRIIWSFFIIHAIELIVVVRVIFVQESLRERIIIEVDFNTFLFYL